MYLSIFSIQFSYLVLRRFPLLTLGQNYRQDKKKPPITIERTKSPFSSRLFLDINSWLTTSRVPEKRKRKGGPSSFHSPLLLLALNQSDPIGLMNLSSRGSFPAASRGKEKAHVLQVSRGEGRGKEGMGPPKVAECV